jgi:hypothetical protein
MKRARRELPAILPSPRSLFPTRTCHTHARTRAGTPQACTSTRTLTHNQTKENNGKCSGSQSKVPSVCFRTQTDENAPASQILEFHPLLSKRIFHKLLVSDIHETWYGNSSWDLLRFVGKPHHQNKLSTNVSEWF